LVLEGTLEEEEALKDFFDRDKAWEGNSLLAHDGNQMKLSFS